MKKFVQAFIHTFDEDSCAEVPNVDASHMPTKKNIVDIAASNVPCAKEKEIMASFTVTQSHTTRNFMEFTAKAQYP